LWRNLDMRNFALHVGILAAIVLTAPGLRNGFLLRAEAGPVGKAESGKTFWQAQMCQYRHGVEAEGAWGPDLASRGLTEAQIRHALREPYGLMPIYTEIEW
jgi:hypothetical protein